MKLTKNGFMQHFLFLKNITFVEVFDFLVARGDSSVRKNRACVFACCATSDQENELYGDSFTKKSNVFGWVLEQAIRGAILFFWKNVHVENIYLCVFSAHLCCLDVRRFGIKWCYLMI